MGGMVDDVGRRLNWRYNRPGRPRMLGIAESQYAQKDLLGYPTPRWPYDGPRIAAAQFEITVYVWDLNTRKRISVFESPLDFGGAASPLTLAATFAPWRPTHWGGLPAMPPIPVRWSVSGTT